MNYQKTINTYLETEEFITAAEYMRRRQNGEIDPSTVRIVLANPATGDMGGFMVKLKQPRYKTNMESFGGRCYA